MVHGDIEPEEEGKPTGAVYTFNHHPLNSLGADLFLGVDWLVDQKDKIHLLEINPYPRHPIYTGLRHSIYTGLEHFIWVLTDDKRYQHQLFGDLMPEYTADPASFEAFKRTGPVVYKRRGARGEAVNIFERPDQRVCAGKDTDGNPVYRSEPDLFLERFIEPKDMDIDGKRFAYVLRSYVRLMVMEENTYAIFEKSFRKCAPVPIGEDTPDKVYKINTATGAGVHPLTFEEEKRIEEQTVNMLDMLFKAGDISGWNPTCLFSDPLIYQFRISSPFAPGWFKPARDHFDNLRVAPLWMSSDSLQMAILAEQYGCDLVIVNPDYSLKMYDGPMDYHGLRIPFKIEREGSGLLHTRGNRIFERFPHTGPKLCLEGEGDILATLLENYKGRKK